MVVRASGPGWRKSSYSSGGGCVEVNPQAEVILVRDSKDPGGPVLTFDRAAFAAFIDGVRDDEFNRPDES
jgi:hypothetical protein